MCHMIYLGTDHPLEQVRWSEEAPFGIAEHPPSKGVLNGKVGKPNIYEIQSQSGCGCGFFTDALNPEELPDRLAALCKLASLIREAASRGDVELYTCWSGDEHEPAAESITLCPKQMLEPGFELRDRQHITFLKQS